MQHKCLDLLPHRQVPGSPIIQSAFYPATHVLGLPVPHVPKSPATHISWSPATHVSGPTATHTCQDLLPHLCCAITSSCTHIWISTITHGTGLHATLRLDPIGVNSCKWCIIYKSNKSLQVKLPVLSAILRWMCGVSLKDRKCSVDLYSFLGVQSVDEVVRRGRLRWFGHVERKSGDDWVSACRNVVVAGVRCAGRGRKTWYECVKDDMKALGLHQWCARYFEKVFWR